jgi:hypothetical protein
VPVISTDVGDVKEVLMAVQGGEIIKRDDASLFLAFRRAMSTNISNDVFKLFGLTSMGEKTLSVYSTL